MKNKFSPVVISISRSSPSDRIIRNFEIRWNYPDMQWESKMLNMPSGPIRFQFKDIP